MTFTGDFTAVQSTQEVRIATAIFPTLSILNHSCCPNTSLNFRTSHLVSPQPDRGSTDVLVSTEPVSTGPEACSAPVSVSAGVAVSIRASRDICPGQEVLHCYGEEEIRLSPSYLSVSLICLSFCTSLSSVCLASLCVGTEIRSMDRICLSLD